MKPRKIKFAAVENFLAALNGITVAEARANLARDTRAYNWNGATVSAISSGIKAWQNGWLPAYLSQLETLKESEAQNV